MTALIGPSSASIVAWAKCMLAGVFTIAWWSEVSITTASMPAFGAPARVKVPDAASRGPSVLTTR